MFPAFRSSARSEYGVSLRKPPHTSTKRKRVSLAAHFPKARGHTRLRSLKLRNLVVAHATAACSLGRKPCRYPQVHSREATSAHSLGRQPQGLCLPRCVLAAKRRQQFARYQFAAAASRLNSHKHSVTHGLRRGLRAAAASRLTRFVGNDKGVSQRNRGPFSHQPRSLCLPRCVLAAKRRQQFARYQFAAAASRLNSHKHSVTHGLRRGLRAAAASRLTRFVGNDKGVSQRLNAIATTWLQIAQLQNLRFVADICASKVLYRVP